jgi:hypothetical protein
MLSDQALGQWAMAKDKTSIVVFYRSQYNSKPTPVTIDSIRNGTFHLRYENGTSGPMVDREDLFDTEAEGANAF